MAYISIPYVRFFLKLGCLPLGENLFLSGWIETVGAFPKEDTWSHGDVIVTSSS